MKKKYTLTYLGKTSFLSFSQAQLCSTLLSSPSFLPQVMLNALSEARDGVGVSWFLSTLLLPPFLSFSSLLLQLHCSLCCFSLSSSLSLSLVFFPTLS